MPRVVAENYKSRPINQSVKQIDHNRWRMGSLVCEHIETTSSPDAIATWADGDCTYVLRKATDSELVSSPVAEPSDEVKVVHEGGTESAVWTIGKQSFCKVHPWHPDFEAEADTITLVKKLAPQITTPDVIYTWTEQDRSFLIVTRIKGSTLRDAWASLSPSQHDSILQTIVTYCDFLAQHTAETLMGATGKPLYEPYLSRRNSDPLGPFTYEQCAEYFSDPSLPAPTLERVFRFYHADLGPSNIIVSDAKVVGIIDWESAGYYPRFWIATKPSVSPGLDLYPSVDGVDDFVWRRHLRMELEVWGYPQASAWFMEWSRLLSEAEASGQEPQQ